MATAIPGRVRIHPIQAVPAAWTLVRESTLLGPGPSAVDQIRFETEASAEAEALVADRS